MKKLLVSLGAVAAIAAPVATVVACGKKDSETKFHEIAKAKDSKFTDTAIKKLEDDLIKAGITTTNKVEDIVIKQNTNKDRPGHYMVLFKHAKIDLNNQFAKAALDAGAYNLTTAALHEPTKFFADVWGLNSNDLKDVTAAAYFWSTTPKANAVLKADGTQEQELYTGNANLCVVDAKGIHDVTFK